MVGTAVAVGRIPMPRQEHFGAHGLGPRDGRIEVIDFEPQQDTVARVPRGCIADRPVVVIKVPAVELHHQPAA
jgi:hypothetical protein